MLQEATEQTEEREQKKQAKRAATSLSASASSAYFAVDGSCSRLFRRVKEVRNEVRTGGGLPIRDTAGCQPALQLRRLMSGLVQELCGWSEANGGAYSWERNLLCSLCYLLFKSPRSWLKIKLNPTSSNQIKPVCKFIFGAAGRLGYSRERGLCRRKTGVCDGSEPSHVTDQAFVTRLFSTFVTV